LLGLLPALYWFSIIKSIQASPDDEQPSVPHKLLGANAVSLSQRVKQGRQAPLGGGDAFVLVFIRNQEKTK
jgi:hypothetical protein